MTTGDLAERLGIRHHSAVGLIDRLLSKSLVKRQTGAEDRRQVLLTLTPKAEKLLGAAFRRASRRAAAAGAAVADAAHAFQAGEPAERRGERVSHQIVTCVPTSTTRPVGIWK